MEREKGKLMETMCEPCVKDIPHLPLMQKFDVRKNLRRPKLVSDIPHVLPVGYNISAPTLALFAAALANNDTLWSDQFNKKENAWLEGRDGNMAKFKPGVQVGGST
jgi:hypothetical protein